MTAIAFVRAVRRLSRAMTLPASFALLAGCQPLPPAPTIPRYNVDVRLSEALRDSEGTYPGVDVYLKGISEWERTHDWETRPDVDEYTRWRGQEDPNGAERVLHLGAGEPPEKILPIDSNAWPLWADRSAHYLVVITNYPRSKPDTNGRDRRMLIIPLATDLYTGDHLNIDVTRDGLDFLTPPRVAPN